jgi:hypothetical protein
MSWVEIFKNDNTYNEKTILGACSFAVMVVVMLADVITGWVGKDLVINPTVYNSFVIVTLGSFGIAGLEQASQRLKSYRLPPSRVWSMNSKTSWFALPSWRPRSKWSRLLKTSTESRRTSYKEGDACACLDPRTCKPLCLLSEHGGQGGH